MKFCTLKSPYPRQQYVIHLKTGFTRMSQPEKCYSISLVTAKKRLSSCYLRKNLFEEGNTQKRKRCIYCLTLIEMTL